MLLGGKSGRLRLKDDRRVVPQVRIVPITALVLDEMNANKGTKRGHEVLGDSLERYGAGRSVVVDRHDQF